MTNRIIGSNKHGFSNEEALVHSLNNKTVKNLNGNLQHFINAIALDKNIKINNDTMIFANLEKNNKYKQDIIIIIEGEHIYISIKIGSGNSVHQEKIEDFITYLEENFNDATQEIKDAFRFYIWADGSLDGKNPIKFNSEGKVIGRFGGTIFSSKFPQKRKVIQDFVDKHSRELMNRFLFVGKHNSKVDYIYYGTPENGSWISANDVIEYNISNPSYSKTINLGRMGIQAWNAGLTGSASSEKKRGQLQVKYGQIKNDLDNLMLAKSNNYGTTIGDKSEFDISRNLNKNKNGSFWKVLNKNLNLADVKNKYIVKVDHRVLSKISNQKVLGKSDAYLIESSEITQNFLLNNNYELTEKLLEREKIDYNIISESGISVKRIDSKSFSIVKMTLKSFNAYFKNYLQNPNLYFAGAILYTSEKEIHKNIQIIHNLQVEKSELLDLVNQNVFNVETYKKIRSYCIQKINNIITGNLELKERLFTGKHVYPSPYYINFITKNGKLTDETIYDYYITTGSGRSKGTYTLVLKPRLK